LLPSPTPSLFPYTTLFRSIALRRFSVSFLSSYPKFPLIIARKHGFILLRLMFENGIFLSVYLLRRKWYSHLNFMGFKFVPCSSRSEEHTSELQSRENLVCR